MDKISILDVNISRINFYQAIMEVKRAIEKNRKLFIVVPNVFVVTECRRDSEYRKIINSADLAFADCSVFLFVVQTVEFHNSFSIPRQG